MEWGDRWLVKFNAFKRKLLSFECHRDLLLTPAEMNDMELPAETSFRLLGLTLLDLWTGSHNIYIYIYIYIYSPSPRLLQGESGLPCYGPAFPYS